MKESTATSDQDSSISSFSSDDSSFKCKFEKEKDKNLRLETKLKGFQSVANQCARLVKDKHLLVQELERLRKRTGDKHTENKKSGVISDLPCSRNQTTVTASQDSSSSFEVVHPVQESNSPVKVLCDRYPNHYQTQKSVLTNDLHETVPIQNIQFPVTTNNFIPNLSGDLFQSPIQNSKNTKPAKSGTRVESPQGCLKQLKELSLKTHPRKMMETEPSAPPMSVPGAVPTAPPMSLPEPEQTVFLVPNEVPSASSTQPINDAYTHQRQPLLVPTIPSNMWGVGARPKDTNTFNWAPLNTINNQGLSKDPKFREISENQKFKDNQNLSKQEVSFNNFSVNAVASANTTAGTETLTLNIPTTTSRTLQVASQPSTEDDLMSLSSMKLTPSPEEKTADARTLLKQNNLVVCPSDDEGPQLASQAHNMVAQLEKGETPLSGMSDMLYKFAQNAAQMETKFTDYQALIQRQQVQIQSFAQQNNSEDLQRLRHENENLVTLLRNQLKLTSPNVTPEVQTTHETQMKSQLSNTSTAEMKKIEQLSHTNEQLYKANKDWHNRWQSFQQKAQQEKNKMESQMACLSGENEKLKEELSSTEQHLEELKAKKLQDIQKTYDRDQEILNLSRELEMTKAQFEDAIRIKRKLETEVNTLKTQISRGSRQATTSVTAKEPSGEVELLKQQLAVFHEDFQREREDRAKAEGKMEKMRKERDTARMEQTSKMKKMQSVLNTKDVDVNRKSKQIEDIQHQMTTLKKELQKERRKNTENLNHQTRSAQHALCPSGGTQSANIIAAPRDVRTQRHTYQVTNHQQTSPEHLPNAWQCRECTFINFPERTICDICGWQNTLSDLHIEGLESESGLPELKSRGEYRYEPITDEPDVVADSDAAYCTDDSCSQSSGQPIY